MVFKKIMCQLRIILHTLLKNRLCRIWVPWRCSLMMRQLPFLTSHGHTVIYPRLVLTSHRIPLLHFLHLCSSLPLPVGSHESFILIFHFKSRLATGSRCLLFFFGSFHALHQFAYCSPINITRFEYVNWSWCFLFFYHDSTKWNFCSI